MKPLARDDIDHQIIALAVADGRVTAAQLSARLPISEPTARRRLEGLLESGFSVKALVNPSKIGYPVSAVLLFQVHLPEVESVLGQLLQHRRVAQAVQVAGGFDIISLAIFQSLPDLSVSLGELVNMLPAIKAVRADLCLENARGYFTSVSPNLFRERGTTGGGLDATDSSLIACLATDGRLSCRELSRRLAIGEAVVRRRLKRLLEERVIVIRPVASPDRLGCPVVAIFGLNVDPRKRRQVARSLSSYPQVAYVTSCTGIFDVMATALFESTGDLSMKLQSFSAIEGVSEVHTFVCLAGERGHFNQFVPRLV